MVNNLDWLGELSLIDFLRDIGKHFTVPYMLAKDSVQVRLERGLSFTEFSYMILQAADFLHLYRRGVEMQMGGADQWGNITAGLELIRRTSRGRGGAAEQPAHGLAYKLLLSPSGTKFGKTEGGGRSGSTPALTSPYAFYQYWLTPTTATSGTYLRWFTEFTRDEIEALEAEVGRNARGAHRATRAGARHHRPDPRGGRRGPGHRRFGRALLERAIHDPAALATLHASTGGFTFRRGARSSKVLADAGLVASRGEARRLIQGGGVTVNGGPGDRSALVPDPVAGEWLDVRLGKRRREIGRIEAP